MQVNDQVPVRHAEIKATVIRCCCGDPSSHAGQVCPTGFREPERTVAYWHRSLLKRAMWRIRSWLHLS